MIRTQDLILKTSNAGAGTSAASGKFPKPIFGRVIGIIVGVPSASLSATADTTFTAKGDSIADTTVANGGTPIVLPDNVLLTLTNTALASGAWYDLTAPAEGPTGAAVGAGVLDQAPFVCGYVQVDIAQADALIAIGYRIVYSDGP